MPRKCIWLDEQSPASPKKVMTSDPQTQNDGNFTNKEVSHLSGKHTIVHLIQTLLSVFKSLFISHREYLYLLSHATIFLQPVKPKS